MKADPGLGHGPETPLNAEQGLGEVNTTIAGVRRRKGCLVSNKRRTNGWRWSAIVIVVAAVEDRWLLWSRLEVEAGLRCDWLWRGCRWSGQPPGVIQRPQEEASFRPAWLISAK